MGSGRLRTLAVPWLWRKDRGADEWTYKAAHREWRTKINQAPYCLFFAITLAKRECVVRIACAIVPDAKHDRHDGECEAPDEREEDEEYSGPDEDWHHHSPRRDRHPLRER